MTTIQETVQQSLTNAGLGDYAQHAAPVVTALVNREQEIVGRILTFARNSDLDENAVRNTLAECGLTMPVVAPPTPAATPATGSTVGGAVDDGIAAVLARIDQTLNGLVSFARRNGYNG